MNGITGKMNQEKIYDIEKRVAELKFSERDLIRERDIKRLKSLDKAEKSEVIENLKNDLFLKLFKTERRDIIVNSYPSKFSGRNDEEFISEVRVEIIIKPLDKNSSINELILAVYINKGFQDSEVQDFEKNIMDRLIEIRKSVDDLKESKKNLRNNI